MSRQIGIDQHQNEALSPQTIVRNMHIEDVEVYIYTVHTHTHTHTHTIINMLIARGNSSIQLESAFRTSVNTNHNSRKDKNRLTVKGQLKDKQIRQAGRCTNKGIDSLDTVSSDNLMPL